MTSWNRRVAAATRARDTLDPVSAERLADLGLPGDLHPDDALAVQMLLRMARGRSEGFTTTLLGRVSGGEGDDDHDGQGADSERLVRIVVMGNENGATTLVGDSDDEIWLDPLTGLPGRDYTLEQIDLGLQGALNAGHTVGVFSIDVDRFKTVNDTRGFAVGDEALRTVAAELVALLRPDDVLARLGGDEFTIVCPDVLGLAEASALGERFRAVC